ncbi:hypothetical protein BG58_41110 [Caballeronia jiangsuensis]|nr:hypothetical protein BG58_41110 [Caballeronia jiangsuensis]
MYGDAVSGSMDLTPPSPKNLTNARETRFAYDANNQLVETRVLNIAVGRYNIDAKPPQYEYGVQDIVSSVHYDALGHAAVTVDGNNNSTYTYYDRTGQKILQIDPEGYAVSWQRDAMGHVIREVRFAARGVAKPDASAEPLELISKWPTGADDRTTDYTYDRNGRLTSDSRLNVRYASIDSNGRVTELTGSAINSYTYDGEGHLLRRVDANGSQYDWTYDQIGRETSEQLPAFTDYLGRQVRIKTTHVRDGLGNLIRETKCSADGNAANDHVTIYAYNTRGMITSSTNANGVTTAFGHDAMGNVTLSTFQRADADGKVINESNNFTYDSAGHQTARWTVSNGNNGPQTQTRYNAYGEVVAQGMPNGTDLPYFAEYDGMGRVIKSNVDRGITHAYVYDANGNATLKMESQTRDLKGLTIDQIFGYSDISQTFTQYDKRNFVVDVIQPTMSSSANHMGLSATKIAIVGASDIPVSVGGGLLAPNTGVGSPNPALSVGTTAFFGGMQVKSTFSLYGNYSAPYTGSGFKGGFILELPAAASLRGLYGAFDTHATIDYSASGVDVQSLGLVDSPVIGVAPSTGRLEYYSSESDPSSISARVPIQLKNQVGHGGALAYTTRIYIRIKSTGQEICVATLNGSLDMPADASPFSSFSSTRTGSFGPAAWISLNNIALTTSSVNTLYFRVKGSTGAFQTVPVTNYPGVGTPGADLSGLSAGNYEMVFVSVQSNGAVLQRSSFNVSMPGGSVTSGITYFDNSAYSANAIGTFVVQQGFIDMYDLLSKSGARISQASVQYRVKGSTGSYSTGILASLGATGAFRWDTRGLASGSYEFLITLKDSKGAALDTVTGNANTSSAAGVSPRYQTGDTTRYVVFRNLPENIFYGRILEYSSPQAYNGAVQNGSGSTYVAASISSSGFSSTDYSTVVWNAPAFPDTANKTWTVKLTLKSQDGAVVYQGTCSITLGATGQPIVAMHSQTPNHSITFTPDVPNVNKMTLYYRPKGSTGDFKAVVGGPYGSGYSLHQNQNGTWTWDECGSLDPSVEYEYYYKVFNGPYKGSYAGAESEFLAKINGTFRMASPQESSQIKWVIGGLNQTDITVHRSQTHNAFGEVSSETDGNGNVTTLSYNTKGYLTSKADPLTIVTLANGYVTSMAPETHYFYDRTGNVIGVRDANGNLNSQVWNYGLDAPAIATEWQGIRTSGQADGGTHAMSYDEFGNNRIMVEQVDGNTSRRTDYTYDRVGNLIEIDRPQLSNGQRSVDRYELDSLGHRVAHINSLGLRDRTYYDYESRVTQTTSAAGRITTYTYIAKDSGWAVTTRDANGRTVVDVLDAYGRTVNHTDLGGHVYTYAYNYAGLIAKQTSTAGQNITYEYYANGLIRRILDAGVKTDARFEYDRNGNRTFEGYASTVGAYAFQQSEATYDALNRLVLVKDPRYTIQYEYDAVGNRIHMSAQYNDGMTGAKANQDYWYQYDAMNRFTVTMGMLKDGRRGTSATDTTTWVCAGTSGDGVALMYDLAGQRRQATYASDGHTESYLYDANGLLTDTLINNILRARRTNDLAGRVTVYGEWNPSGAATSSLTRTWDGDNLLLDEYDNQKKVGTRYELMTDGTIAAAQTYGEPTTMRTTYTYEWWDAAKQKEVKAQASNQQIASWSPGFSQLTYDVNGHLKSAFDASGNRSFSYWTDADGHVLQRDELSYGGAARASHAYYYFADNQIGNVGNDGVDRIDYVKQMATAGVSQIGLDDRYKRFKPANSADFDVNYQPINSLYPGSAPGRYTVKAGDTLRGLAAAYYGDATLWYVIADANGLSASDVLTPGSVLSIPNKVENIHNSATTFKPYDAGKAIGDTRPTLLEPPPQARELVIAPLNMSRHSGNSCGSIFVVVVAVIVAVVVTVVTEGAASPVLAEALEGLGMSMGAAEAAGGVGGVIVGAAAGSAASQGILISAGQQGSFSFGQMGVAAVAAGVTAGVGIGIGGAGAAGGSAAGSSGSESMWGAVAAGGARSVATQGMEIALGMQHGFDWKGLAASVIASGVGYGVGQTRLGEVPYTGAMASSLAAGTASTLVRCGSLQRDAAGIVGDTIGAMVTAQMAQRSEDVARAKTEQIINGNSANPQFIPADAASFDATATSLGLTPAQARGLLAGDSGASLVSDPYSPYTRGVDARAVPYPQITVRELPPIDIPVMGTVRPLSGWESFKAFNPVGQFAEGMYDRGAAMASGVWNAVTHPVDTATAIGQHYTNAYDAGHLGDTILNDVGSAITGSVSSLPPLAAVNGLYRQDTAGAAYVFGGSAMDAALFAAPELAGPTMALGGAALERGVAIFGPKLADMFETGLAQMGAISYVVEKSPTFQNSALETMSRIESRFGGATREVGFIVDSEFGNILTVARQPYGQLDSSFRFDSAQWDMAAGNWITHNHPSGLTLGLEDMAGAVSSGARGIRASTAGGTYELAFDGTFASAYRGDYAGAYGYLHAQTGEIGRGIMTDIRSGSLTVPSGLQGVQYKGFLANEMWARFATQASGLQYRFIQR